MTQTNAEPDGARIAGSPTGRLHSLRDRKLDHYPLPAARYRYLAITVLATVILYYQLYIQGAVATKIITSFGMTFTQFVVVSIVGNLLGAFASLAAGLADRWGRANLVVIGLFITGLLVLFALPHAPNTLWYIIFFAVLSIVEGMILVATPALIRDFSPQVGRAQAMGFWTMGPVLGSLVVTMVSSNTLDNHPDWRFQFYVCGIAGLVVAVIALVGLRELSPGLRDQLMVSLNERALIEARAGGLDTETALHGHWRQMMRFDIVGPAIAISLFLMFYYIAVGFFVVYFATTFGYSEARANALANWYWIANAIALIVAGVVSDKIRVRKPLMAIGTVISVIGTAIFAMLSTRPDTGYYTFALVLVVIAVGGGIAYCAWMASFTETVERHNPAATATGLAIWGWTVRITVTLALIVLTFVVPATSTLVDQGTRVSHIVAEYPEQVATASAVEPATLNALAANPRDARAGMDAVGQLIGAGLAATPREAAARLQQLSTDPIPPGDQAFLADHAADVEQAQSDNPGQWQIWWWICVVAQILFVPFIFVLSGRWNPRRAREDARAHETMIQRELAELHHN
ncbi:MFS transporter [Gordonia hankookensis]|uniref:MFS transporter n=1 Tax=Gordonia hankookensis TaxID=589403 RepID=UPI002952BF75|nr:MFS transporter [Gordonia hankookensis]